MNTTATMTFTLPAPHERRLRALADEWSCTISEAARRVVIIALDEHPPG